MNRRLLDFLERGSHLEADPKKDPATGEMRTEETRLRIGGDGTHPVVRGIPRLVESSSYTASFDFQWQHWAVTQYDSINGTSVFADRFRRYLGEPGEICAGIDVLDAGCGAGPFIDVISPYARHIVGVDRSAAVESAKEAHRELSNVDVVQADLTDLPFRADAFDLAICFGVLQHMPDPRAAFDQLVRVVKPGGIVAVWVYERKPWEGIKPRHLVRRYSAGLPRDRALRFVNRYYRTARPLRRRLASLPPHGRLSRLVPVSDLSAYAGGLEAKLTADQVEEWERLDTYDMLITAHDHPQRPRDVEGWFAAHGIKPIRRAGAEAIAMWGKVGDR